MFQFRGIFQSCIKETTFWCCCIVFLHKRETSHNKLFKLHLNAPQHWRRSTQIVDFTSLCWYFYWSPALIISFWAFSRRVLECVCLFCSETKKRVDRGWRRERKEFNTSEVKKENQVVFVTHCWSAERRSAAVRRTLHPLSDQAGHAHLQPLRVLVQKKHRDQMFGYRRHPEVSQPRIADCFTARHSCISTGEENLYINFSLWRRWWNFGVFSYLSIQRLK